MGPHSISQRHHSIDSSQELAFRQPFVDRSRTILQFLGGRVRDGEAMQRAVLRIERANWKRRMGIEAGHEYDTSAMRQQRHRALEVGVGGGIPVNVDTVGRKLRNRGDYVVGFIIDSSLGTQLPAILEVSIASSRDNDSGAQIGCQLEHCRTNIARTAVYED